MIIISCVSSPYMLAFQDDESGPSNMTILDTAINCLFFVDIILNFFTAYQDEEMNMIDDHRVSFFPYIFILYYRASLKSI